MQKGTSLMKNKLLKHTGAMLLLLACCLTSCIKEDGFTPTDKASVTLTFTTRVGANGESTLPSIEQMKTLRVIMVRQNPQEVVWNIKHTIPAGKGEDTFKFNDVRVAEGGEMFDFYAIANEAAFTEKMEDGNDIDVDALKNMLVTLGTKNDGSLNITETTGVPQTKIESFHVEAKANQSHRMQLEFAVAKVELTFNNTTETEQTITNLRFPDIMPNAATTPLFTPAEIAAVGSRAVNFTEGMSIPAALDNASKTFYVYETKAPQDGYKMTATWGKQWDLPFSLVEIKRGQHLRINVDLIKRNGLKVSWTVLPWEGEDSDLEFTSEFNGSLTEQLIKRGEVEGKPYVLVAEGLDSQQRERYAQFKFVMTSPVGQNWVAHLSNPNDFEFVGDYSGVGVTQEEANQNTGVVTLTVKPRREFQSGTPTTTRLYITVDGLEGAQTINPLQEGVRPFPGEINYIDIIQVSTADYDTVNNN